MYYYSMVWLCFGWYDMKQLYSVFFSAFGCAVKICRVCNACNRPLLTPSFVRYPDGSIVHMHCAKAHKTVQHSYT